MGSDADTVMARPRVTIRNTDGLAEGTVVYVHGTLDSSDSFKRGADKYLLQWVTVTYDRRGWGRSRRDGLVACGMSPHVSDLLEVLAGHVRPIVVGHSYGGLLALNAVSMQPHVARALVVFEPPIRWLPWWPEEAPWEALVRETSAEDTAEITRRLRSAVLGRQLTRNAARADTEEIEDGHALLSEMTDTELDAPGFDPLNFPVPLVSAAGSRSLEHHRHTAQHLAELVPCGTYVELPNVAHIAHITHPEEFASLVRRAEEIAARSNRESN